MSKPYPTKSELAEAQREDEEELAKASILDLEAMDEKTRVSELPTKEKDLQAITLELKNMAGYLKDIKENRPQADSLEDYWSNRPARTSALKLKLAIKDCLIRANRMLEDFDYPQSATQEEGKL